MSILDWLNPLNAITDALTKAYEAKLNAANDSGRIAAQVEIENLQAKRDVLISAAVNDRPWSPRSVMSYVVCIFVLKIIVWDSVLQLGVTP